MKQRLQGLVMGAIAMVLLLGTATVFAATTRTIEVRFGTYRTYLFDQEFTVRNVQGELLQPFSYNGSVYVPVEAILHAMGDNASWYADSGILRFGRVDERPTEVNERVPLNTAARHFDAGGVFGNSVTVTRPDSVNMGGVAYQNALRFHNGDTVSLLTSTPFTLHNLNGQFSLLSGYVGRVDGSQMGNATISFFGDGQLIKYYELRATDMPTPISVPVEGVVQLRISVNMWPSTYALVAYLE